MDITVNGLRIGIIANTAWNLFHFRSDLILYLRQSGNKVFGIAPADDFEDRLKEVCDGYVRLTRLQRKGTNAMSDLSLYHEMVDIMKTLQLDLVLCYTVKPNIYGTLAAHRLGIPVINTITGLGFAFLENRIINKVVVRLYKYALEKSSRVIFQNKDDRHLFVRKGLVNAGKTSLIRGSGVNISRFHPIEACDTHDGKIRFTFIGRLLYDKGVIELLKGFSAAFEKNNNIVLDLVGDRDEGNPASVSMQDLAVYKNRNDICFHGYQENVIPYLSRTDVVILPSYREGMPRVILEGMSMAKPVIATNVPGCKDMVIHDVNGLLIDVKSHKAVENAVLDMASLNQESRHAMGIKGRENVVQLYSSQAIIKEYELIIHDIMSGSRYNK